MVESQKETDYDELMKEYNDLFQGLRYLPGEHTIWIHQNIPPVIDLEKCHSSQVQLKDELDRMEKLTVVQKIDYLVIVVKNNGKLRVCLDQMDLNPEIKREHFTREGIMVQFANAKYFSKLDASSGFWQLKLDEASSKQCTFNTPYGRYRFLRLPFGIASAPEVDHKTIHLIYELIVGVDTSMDDIIVWGKQSTM